MPRTLRICAAVSTTQLLPLIHILRHENPGECEDVLLWYSYERAASNRRLMQEVIKSHSFAGVYEISDLKILSPDKVRGIARPFASLLRHRDAARRIRSLLNKHLLDGQKVEIWTDEPIHFPMRFLHGLFPDAAHVKFPHCYDHDNLGSADYRERMLAGFAKEATWHRKLFWHFTRIVSGVQYTTDCGLQFDRAYTFGVTSPWSKNSLDVSHLINTQEMTGMYLRLPSTLREEIEEKIHLASPVADRPWALLLLFGLSDLAFRAYCDAVRRIYQERPEIFENLQLVIKPHPLNNDNQPETLAKELSQIIGGPVGVFDCTLNMDVLWSVIPAKLVMAGPCGALPTVKRLGSAQAVLLREVFALFENHPEHDKALSKMFLNDFELW